MVRNTLARQLPTYQNQALVYLVEYTMERVGACLLMAIFSLDRYNEVQGDNQFYMDILEFFGIDTPVFVSTYDYDIDTRY